MTRITSAGTIKDGKQYLELAGLSTDSKPTEGVLTGSVYIEVDTGKPYFFDEESESWMEAGGENG